MSLFRALLPWIVVLLLLAVIASVAFIEAMYDGETNAESLIGAAYYAAQTVTTVGYGDWIPRHISLRAEAGTSPYREKLLAMKLFSVAFMLFGAFIFACIIGITANWFSRLLPR